MWGVRKITRRRETLPTPVFWPREFLGGYSPWGRKESDKIGWLNTNSHEVSPFVKKRYQQYLHNCVHVQLLIRVQLFAALWTVAPKILYPWNFSGKNTEMGCHFLLQGIFPTQELNPGLLHLLHWLSGSFLLNHLGNKSLHNWVILKYLTWSLALGKFSLVMWIFSHISLLLIW